MTNDTKPRDILGPDDWRGFAKTHRECAAECVEDYYRGYYDGRADALDNCAEDSTAWRREIVEEIAKYVHEVTDDYLPDPGEDDIPEYTMGRLVEKLIRDRFGGSHG